MTINPVIGTRSFFDGISWNPILTAHPKRSSELEVSQNHLLLRKTKVRHRRGRDAEFFNLVFWNALLDIYQEEYKVRIYAPTPYLADGNSITMEYAPGIDLERLLKAGNHPERDMQEICRLLGQLYKIKRNDSLIHGDFAPRHVIMDGGLFLVDLEKAGYDMLRVRQEEEAFTADLKALLPGLPGRYIAEGINSIPQIFATTAALELVRPYGTRVQNRLRQKYLPQETI